MTAAAGKLELRTFDYLNSINIISEIGHSNENTLHIAHQLPCALLPPRFGQPIVMVVI
ncbi:hypothetical protein MY5147_008698 [Beauveria neobassiana]